MDVVYPNPGFVIVDDVIAPPDIDTVAVAVVPTPTPRDFGAAIDTVADPVYPDPPLTMERELIVPAAETTAVTVCRITSSFSLGSSVQY